MESPENRDSIEFVAAKLQRGHIKLHGDGERAAAASVKLTRDISEKFPLH